VGVSERAFDEALALIASLPLNGEEKAELVRLLLKRLHGRRKK